MKYAFKGPADEHRAPGGVKTVWGVRFPCGEPVEVTDPELAAKLEGMGEFETQFAPLAASLPPEPPKPAPAPKKKRGRPRKKAAK